MPFADWRSLLLERVTSHDELQVLLLLQSRAHLELNAREVASELGVSERVCVLALQRLSAQGLLSQSANGQSFRFAPATVSLARNVEALEQAYGSAPLTVIRALSETAMERVRASAARAFPEALRKRRSER